MTRSVVDSVDSIAERCAQIADEVVPKYRAEEKSYSCTGVMAKRWQAAWDAACLALGHDPDTIHRGTHPMRKTAKKLYLTTFEVHLSSILDSAMLKDAHAILNLHYLGRSRLKTDDEVVPTGLREASYAIHGGVPVVVTLGLLPNGDLVQVTPETLTVHGQRGNRSTVQRLSRVSSVRDRPSVKRD